MVLEELIEEMSKSTGFYYDFDFGDTKVGEEDLQKIEDEMKKLVKTWESFDRREVTSDEAIKRFSSNPYKLELISELVQKKEAITFYTSGEFTDLCRGGHTAFPKNNIKHFKLLSVAGAYWRGDEKNKMLTRIYGTAFKTKDELDAYLKMRAEAKERDHRKLGEELDLFTFSPLIGSGLPLYTPKGALIRRILNEYIEKIQSEEGYSQVWTPQIAKAELFKKSGHYDKYHEDMFLVKSHYSNEEMYLKPMNCPQHTQIYASKPRSYKDLPIRYTDFAMLYRDERPGQLNGLARVRSFSQDDCHVFCREDQVDEEIDKMLAMTKKVMARFGFNYKYRLSTRDPNHPEKYYGDPKQWDFVEKWAEKIMKRNNIEHYVAPGEASFYAPKMDLMATDALGREWQLSTVQIDYVQPTRFGLTYIADDGSEKTPVMIHRAILGSSERLMMILIEHYAGKFPFWLAPVQLKLIPISEKHAQSAHQIEKKLHESGYRVETDARAETMQSKIRTASLQKIPFMGIIGDKEIEDTDNIKVSMRDQSGKILGTLTINDILTHFKALE
jgi:threonyl-tRNA synthetase